MCLQITLKVDMLVKDYYEDLKVVYLRDYQQKMFLELINNYRKNNPDCSEAIEFNLQDLEKILTTAIPYERFIDKKRDSF